MLSEELYSKTLCKAQGRVMFSTGMFGKFRSDVQEKNTVQYNRLLSDV